MKLLPALRSPLLSSSFHRQISRLLNGFPFDDESFDLVSPSVGWIPSLDVAETEGAVVVKAEIAGIDPKEIDISVNGDTLYLKGERKEEKEEKGKTWHRVERSYGAFTRAVTLPVPVSAEKVEATAKDGVLTITLPKSEASKVRHVTVKTQ
jgi:HSP20 family protein